MDKSEVKATKHEEVDSEYYRQELAKLKKHVKLKGVIMSEDGGKTWFVARQDYVAHANNEYSKHYFAEVNLEGLPLKIDLKDKSKVGVSPLPKELIEWMRKRKI
jgi:hypothetical protein